MKVTRDVISDLLPAYVSGEATADTRALIEELSAQDPEIARLVESARPERSQVITQHTVALPPNLERETVTRTRALLRRRSWTMGLALWFTMLPFSFVSTDGISFLMMRDFPASRFFWVGAAYLWFDYLRIGRRMRRDT